MVFGVEVKFGFFLGEISFAEKRAFGRQFVGGVG
jgi:hypothetical protein